MSIDRCMCGVFVDTDYDDEFYSYDDPDAPGMCSACRDRTIEEQIEDERLNDPRHHQAKDLNRSTA